MRAFVAVGSNIEPEKNVKEALGRLSKGVRITAVSTFYLTEPAERASQGRFYNGVVEVDTSLGPHELKEFLKEVEDGLGRTRSGDRHAPRTIDLDLILYGEMTVDDGRLRLPDPDIGRYAFIAVPLAELAPDIVVPGTGLTAGRIAGEAEASGMVPLDGFTAELRSDHA